MVRIGKFNELRLTRVVDFGVYLDGEELGEILLPGKEVPMGCSEGDLFDVFIYLDSEDRLIATREEPYAQVGDIVSLKVAAVTRIGAFLDWGLPKDILVPHSEQREKMEEGKEYLVKIYLDKKSNRIVATQKLGRFLDEHEHDYQDGQKVQLKIIQKTDLGYKAIVDGKFSGVIYQSEVFKDIKIGQEIPGYIKKVREDRKLDLSLSQIGYFKVIDTANFLIEKLEANAGYLPLTDKSSPEDIYKYTGESKKTFKKAVGALYKARAIKIEDKGIRLIK